MVRFVFPTDSWCVPLVLFGFSRPPSSKTPKAQLEAETSHSSASTGSQSSALANNFSINRCGTCGNRFAITRAAAGAIIEAKGEEQKNTLEEKSIDSFLAAFCSSLSRQVVC
jgi:hypothetical protein